MRITKFFTNKRKRATDIWTGQNCSIFLTDIAGFSDSARTDKDRKVIRRAMHKILEQAFKDSGVPWIDCRYEDRGDGILIVVPPQVPTSSVVDPLIAYLADGLDRHNARADDATRFQLRAGLHVGPVEVEPDAEWMNGEAFIHVRRLVEAQTFKRRLAKSNASLGFITSEFVYDGVIKHRPGQVDPAEYQKVTEWVKERRVDAWIYLASNAEVPPETTHPEPA